MHRDRFLRLKRADPPPSDPKSENELMLFSNAAGRAGQVDHHDVFHLFAWVDEITGGGGGSGIQFDTDPQEGGFLKTVTTGRTWFEAGTYIHLAAVEEISLNAGEGTILLDGGFINIGGGLWHVQPSNGDVGGLQTGKFDFRGPDIQILAGVTSHQLQILNPRVGGGVTFAASKLLEIDAESDPAAAISVKAHSVVSGSPHGTYEFDVVGKEGEYGFAPDFPGFYYQVIDNAGSGWTFRIANGISGDVYFEIRRAVGGAITYHIQNGAVWMDDL
jgi:hypothetical protein